MLLNQVVIEPLHVLELLVCLIPGKECRVHRQPCQQGDEKAEADGIAATGHEGPRQQQKRQDGPEYRDVVEHEVEVRVVHVELL